MHLLHLQLPFSHHLPRPLRRPISSSSSSSSEGSEGSHPPARDHVVDFGRHRGRRLGALPSSYLRWVASTLRARDSEPWARLADHVLRDPVYRDRLEWEHAARLLSGDAASSSPAGAGVVAELLGVAERFGWDYDDREGWARVDFELLGTSFGGRIPRLRRGLSGGGKGRVLEAEEEAKTVVREKREERRERRRAKKREQQMEMVNGGSSNSRSNGGFAGEEEEKRERLLTLGNNPFPGRGALLDKIKKRQG